MAAVVVLLRADDGAFIPFADDEDETTGSVVDAPAATAAPGAAEVAVVDVVVVDADDPDEDELPTPHPVSVKRISGENIFSNLNGFTKIKQTVFVF